MDPSNYGYVGMGVFVVVGVAAFVLSRVLFGKQKLAPSPPFGALPIAELGKYYALRDAPIAWERVRGWNLNVRPGNLGAPGPIDHLILMPRLLEFCSGASGKLTLVFNFLVGAIEHVDFDPTIPPGVAPPGVGLMTIHTPSGQTLVLASGGFAQALQRAVAQAR